MEPERLRELTSAAYSLQMKPLAELGCDALAKLIEWKSVEEIRQAFGLFDDATEVSCFCEHCFWHVFSYHLRGITSFEN